jgi:hypothetical protein
MAFVNAGEVWDVDANGAVGKLVVTAIDAAGNLTGTIFGDPIQGFYFPPTESVCFTRQQQAELAPDGLQVYTGYAFTGFLPAAGAPKTVAAAGTFEAFRAAGGTASRHIFGWMAWRPEEN